MQCKNWRSRGVGVGVVRELYGVLAAEHAHQAVIVCSGNFTQDARRFAAGKPIRLVDGDGLLSQVQGVQRANDTARSAPERNLPADSPTLCPRCGGRLVLRTAKRGEHAGRRFLGCETFPSCCYIENLPDG